MTDPLLNATSIIGSLFGNTFGSPMILGILGFFAIVVFGVALRLGFEMLLILIIPSLFILSQYGFIPTSIMVGLAVLCGILIFYAFMRIVRR